MDGNITIFSTIGVAITAFTGLLSQMSLSSRFKDLQLAISLLLTISIMYKGYLVLAGKNQDPIRDLIFDLAKKAFILAFVMNVDGWLTLSNEAIKGFHTWAMTTQGSDSGSVTSMYKQMDGFANTFIKTLGDYFNKSASVFNIGDLIIGFLVSLVMIVAFFAICVSLFFTLVATQVTNAFLITSLPLALFCLMWNPTKQVFTQWLSLFISNIFLLLFLVAFMQFFGDWIGSIFNLAHYYDNNNVSFFQMMLEIPLVAAVLVQIINVIKELARNLAQVTLDSAVSGTAITGGAGAALGYGARALQNRGGGRGKSVEKPSPDDNTTKKQEGLAARAGTWAGNQVKKARQILQNMRNK